MKRELVNLNKSLEEVELIREGKLPKKKARGLLNKLEDNTLNEDLNRGDLNARS